MSRSPTRRAVLSAAVAAPVATVAPAAAAGQPFDPYTDPDTPLWRLWCQILELEGRIETLRPVIDSVHAGLPAWAQGGPDGRGGHALDPEWTPDMLARHAIPPELGRRPSFADITALNKRLVDNAVDQGCVGIDVKSLSFDEFAKIVRTARAAPEVLAVNARNDARVEAFRTRVREAHDAYRQAGIPDLEAKIGAMQDEQSDCLSRIAESPASSPLGALVKLRAWHLEVIEWGDEDVDGRPNIHIVAAIAALEAAFPNVAAAVGTV